MSGGETDSTASETSADSPAKRLGRLGVTVAGAAVAVAVGWLLFVVVGGDSLARLLGVVLAVVVGVVGMRVASRMAQSAFAPYNVAEVAVEGPITRDGRRPLPTGPMGTAADDVVEQVAAADADGNVDALVVRLNTPGGAVVPSDDVRVAVERFDGPTVAYATDVCASGGYWIASGCGRVVARDGSLVGSIGVVGSTVNAHDLADRLGVSYERFAAGKYKDAGMALKELSADERAYLQGIVDDYYEAFVDRVVEGRGVDEETVRDTEARVYVGRDAEAVGLVDDLGTRRDVETYLAGELDAGVSVREFEPRRGLMARVRGGARAAAYALGAGAASALAGDADHPLRLR
jgi:protease-4